MRYAVCGRPKLSTNQIRTNFRLFKAIIIVTDLTLWCTVFEWHFCLWVASESEQKHFMLFIYGFSECSRFSQRRSSSFLLNQHTHTYKLRINQQQQRRHTKNESLVSASSAARSWNVFNHCSVCQSQHCIRLRVSDSVMCLCVCILCMSQPCELNSATQKVCPYRLPALTVSMLFDVLSTKPMRVCVYRIFVCNHERYTAHTAHTAHINKIIYRAVLCREWCRTNKTKQRRTTRREKKMLIFSNVMCEIDC